jgi:hypothetical protein
MDPADAVSHRQTSGGAVRWIDSHPYRAFGAISLFYVAVTAVLSSLKLLWLDELITLHIARLGSPSAIWTALKQGADPNPPLIHLAVLACTRLFGTHTYAFRLPAVLGYWLGMLALFLFLKRRVPPTWALLGTVISLGMGAFEWSYECRSYAVFYGTTMLAVYLWSRAIDSLTGPRSRGLCLCGMTLALAAGICTNYFSVLAFLPIAAGELARTLRRTRAMRTNEESILKSIDVQVWFALALAAAPLLFLRPLAERAISLYRPYAWNKVNFSSTNIGYLEMVEAMLVPLAVLALCLFSVWALSRLCRDCRARLLPPWLRILVESNATHWNHTPRPPLAEVVAVSTLLIYPYLGWLLASIHGGMFSGRFVIPVCFGMAIAGAWMAFLTFGQIRNAGAILLALFLLWFAVRESYMGFSYNEQQTALFRLFHELRAVDVSGEPIAVTDNLLVVPFHYYAPPDIASRVVYPMDITAIMNRRGEASGEINLWTGRNSYGFPVMPLATFQRSVSSYLLVTSEPDWLLDDLHAHHDPDDLLVSETHTEPLGFEATPLAHGWVEFFRVYGDRFPGILTPAGVHRWEVMPNYRPFSQSGEVPSAPRSTP